MPGQLVEMKCAVHSFLKNQVGEMKAENAALAKELKAQQQANEMLDASLKLAV